MASSIEKEFDETAEQPSKDETLECPICLQTCLQPTLLPCGHVFCFLCTKGIAFQSKKCAMCRQEIPRDYLEKPKLLQPLPDTTTSLEDEYDWFYEGRDGWWKYDERTSAEIESAYLTEIPSFDILICGELYVIDFQNNVQHRKYGYGRKRTIKRDKKSAHAIGIAGCRF
ncbi:E3 ubiquitin-protein ligase RNF146-A-like [Chrysoperla carnea]|uniref:E3 ubiquitin-protein ligase RNF146-A-like n=1 Tax=Chrysoperla carnea TaxID=189513 RepID=UPI001D07891C|nr:E3 ubiquitin-protein ligase RNF146-A-like [Chrysoperla carnea]